MPIDNKLKIVYDLVLDKNMSCRNLAIGSDVELDGGNWELQYYTLEKYISNAYLLREMFEFRSWAGTLERYLI